MASFVPASRLLEGVPDYLKRTQIAPRNPKWLHVVPIPPGGPVFGNFISTSQFQSDPSQRDAIWDIPL